MTCTNLLPNYMTAVKGMFFAILIAITLITAEAAQTCKEPNANATISCSNPTGSVNACSDVTSGEGCQASTVYVIKQFPDGSQDADTGKTKQENSDCYQSTQCIWGGGLFEGNTCKPRSVTLPGNGAWFQSQKVVIDTSVPGCTKVKG